MNDNHIECSVCNCKYHADSKTCKAGKVVISPDHAEKCSDTGCETFCCK